MAATIRARRLVISTAFIVAVLGSVILSAIAQAAPGDLDPTFSGDGEQTTDFGGSSEAKAVVVQPDGKVVVVGATFRDFAVALARYNPNGTLDTSFSGDGRQTTDFGVANAVALQADGKIVVVGSIDSSFALARYNPNGSLDTSFSGDGKQTTGIGGSSEDEATGVAIQGNGKIVVVGTATDPSTGANPKFALARYNPNGSLDTSFSGDGKQTTDFGATRDGATGVALQGDGKIVAVGAADSGATTHNFALARYNPNGSLDTSFSGDGKQTTDFGGVDEANGVAIRRTARLSRSATPTSATGGGTSPSPATTRAARSTRASRATASRPPPERTSSRQRRSDPKRRQDRRRRRRLRPRPLQPQRLARHELLGRR